MILDTSAVSGIMAGDPVLQRVLECAERHHLPAIVLGECRFRILSSGFRAELEHQLDVLERESFVLTVDRETARHYAIVRDELKRQGTPIPENDVWLSALPRQHDLPVITRDLNFDLVPGVQRIGL